jgi:ArsR family metal-binding transcriptional regulator
MSVIVNPVIAGNCKNCGESTRYFYVALKNGAYSHLFDCTSKTGADE